MNRIFRAVLPLSLLLGGAGCTSIEPLQKTSLQQEQQKETVFGAVMLDGLKRGDYSKFSHNFCPDLKQSASEAAFQKICGELIAKQEKVIGWKALDSLDRGGVYRTEVWKVSLEKKTKTGSAVIDRLFYVTKSKIDGKEAVIGFKFDALF